MTICARLNEGGSLDEGIPWETIIKIVGVVGVWIIVLLLFRRRK